MTNSSIVCGFETERVVTGAFSGVAQTLGAVLSNNPVIIVLDNQSTVSVAVSVDGVNTWKTFTAGEALVLDLRANHGIAANFTIPLYTQFYVTATGGTGSFRMSVLYAR